MPTTFDSNPGPTLTLTLTLISGSIANNKWISLVDETLNSGDPCLLGRVAAGIAGTSHTGSLQAINRTVTIDSRGLSSNVVFAVCYTEAMGPLYQQFDATWTDSGIQ